VSFYCFVFILITVGLWPFNFWELNRASQDSINGLHLTPPAAVYTSNPMRKLLGLKEFTILLNLSPDSSGSSGYARILSYSLDGERVNFMIGQWKDSLVFKLKASGKPKPIHFETEGVLKKGEKGCIAIIFNGEKLLLYQNGEIRNEKITGPLSFANWDGSYPLVVGSEATGKFPWKGNIYSIKIFDRALLPEEMERVALPQSSQRDGHEPLIDYSFDAAGSVIRDRGKGQPADLLIPNRFRPYKRAFLGSLDTSLKKIRRSIWDILLNLFGFVLLGFLLSEYFNRRYRSMKYVFLLSVTFGFLLSLTIEVLQAFLPTRVSSMTDLMANTIGTGIGFIAYIFLSQMIIHSRKMVHLPNSA
jgi:VanZ family protein